MGNIICSYLTYKESSLSELEPYAAKKNETLLDEVSAIPWVKECVVLKTCNRVEVYIYSENPEKCKNGLASYGSGKPNFIPVKRPLDT